MSEKEKLIEQAKESFEKECKRLYISCSWEDYQKRYVWLHPTCKILCDFGQCDNASMVLCKKCQTTLCLSHIVKHLKTCCSTMDVNVRMMYEQEMLDGISWKN